MSFLIQTKINPLSLIAFTLCSIFLIMVQYGFISPNGIIVISSIQYTWIFWFSVIAFIVSMANLIVRIPRHAKWSTGFSGKIVRTVKIAGENKDYFIRGASDTPIKEVLLENWPFSEHDQESNWHVVDELGNDVTTEPLSALNGTATVVIDEQ